MQVAAIAFIILVLAANFYYQTLGSFVLALLAFPVLLWVLFRRRRTMTEEQPTPAAKEPAEGQHA